MELKTLLEDERGSINVLVGPEFLLMPEVTVFKTRGGFARGGCIHQYSQEHLVVIEGVINYIYEDQITGELEEVELTTGDRWTIPAKTPHYLISVTDSVIMEWGPKVEEKQAKFGPFREKVLEWNKKLLQQ